MKEFIIVTAENGRRMLIKNVSIMDITETGHELTPAQVTYWADGAQTLLIKDTIDDIIRQLTE